MTVPALRFPEFGGEWKPSHAGDAFTNSKAKGEAGLPIYSVTLNRGLVRRDSLDRHMAADAADETNLRAQEGELVYNMMRMWQGAVGKAEIECMVSPAYVVLTPKAETSSDFFDHWFQAQRMLYLLWAYSHGLTSDRLRLYYNDFAQIPLHLPSLPEQKKIAAFLGAVDARIAGARRRRDLLETYKRGLMQALFSRTLRFTRPDGTAFSDWEEKRLGDAVSFSKGKGISKADISADGQLPCIRYGELYTLYSEVIATIISRTNIPASKLTLSQAGDVIIPASGEDRLDMARACCVLDVGIALGGDLNILRHGMNGRYLAYYLSNAKRREIARYAQGNSVVHLYGTQLKLMDVSIPHPDEQQKIADALSAMDAKIDAVSAKITQLEAFKKGLLQQMFA